jgi:lysophospholipase L1-like esterase
MKTFILIISLLLTKAYAECEHDRDLVIIGDSQIGATWSRSYIGNYLNECLKHESNLNYVIYGRGATTIGNWIDRTHLDHIEVIQRTRSNPHENIGAHQAVPMCKKRLDSILKSHLPQTLVLSFGGNWIGQDERSFAKKSIKQSILLTNNQRLLLNATS